MRKIVSWLGAAIACVAIVVFIIQVGSEWAEAAIQGVAAIGGGAYWMHRSRPIVTLRVRSRDGHNYVELANVGNRTAKQVTLQSDPPVALHPNQPKGETGMHDEFGDMDRGQRYTLLIAFTDETKTLQKTVFRLSYDRTFWFGRRNIEVSLGGSGSRWTIAEDTGTHIDFITTSLLGLNQQVAQISQALKPAPQPQHYPIAADPPSPF